MGNAGYYACKRRGGYRPQGAVFRRHQGVAPVAEMAIRSSEAWPGVIPEGGYGGCETGAPWAVVIETDCETGIIRYVIDGERCWSDIPGVEQEANRALIESAIGLKTLAWATLGYLRSPAEKRDAGRDAALAEFAREQLERAEGRR